VAKEIDFNDCSNKLHDGLVGLFQTDTVTGLGCRFDSPDGVARIREIKGINESSPLAVLISSEDQLDLLKVRRSRLFNRLVEHLWPGALTIVVTSEEGFPCCGNRNTLGLRMPDSDLLRKIIETAGLPIAATSANSHGKPAPKALKDVEKQIAKMADCKIDLPIKSTGIPSTVVAIEAGEIRIVREGSVSKSEILAAASEEEST